MERGEEILYRFMREVIVEVYLDGRISYISPNCIKVLGINKDNIIGRHLGDFIKEFSIDIEKQKVKFYTEDKRKVYVFIEELKDYEFSDKKCFSLINISEFEDEINRVHRIKNILDKSDDIIYSYDVEEVEFTYLNSAVFKNLGYTAKEHREDPTLVFQMTHPDDLETQIKLIEGNVDYSKAIRTRFKHKSGEYMWFENFAIPSYNKEGKLIFLEGITRNINESMMVKNKLEYLSFHDGLTGLYNRTFYEQEKRILDSLNLRAGVVVCDLDNMKSVNDTLGHMEGDKLLVKLSELLKENFSEKADIFRTGGDEFVIFVKEVAREVFNRGVQSLKRNLHIYNESNRIKVLLSVGYQYCVNTNGNIEEAIREADRLMYLDKKNDKGKIYMI